MLRKQCWPHALQHGQLNKQKLVPGLGQRIIMWRYDANIDKTVGSTERYHFMYDDRWRVVGVFRDADSTPKESFVYHAAGNAGQRSPGLCCDSTGSSLTPQ